MGALPDPALRHRVAFDISRAAAAPGEVNPALDRLARYMNLLAASGVRPAPGVIVAVIYGAATPSVLTDAAYQARFHRANVDVRLIEALRRAGVTIHVCSYALAHQKIDRSEIAPGIAMDLAAMVTLADLQLKGWAVIQG